MSEKKINEFGEEIPNPIPSKAKVTIEVDREMYKKFKAKTVIEGTKVVDIVTEAMKDYLSKDATVVNTVPAKIQKCITAILSLYDTQMAMITTGFDSNIPCNVNIIPGGIEVETNGDHSYFSQGDINKYEIKKGKLLIWLSENEDDITFIELMQKKK